tara:strand:+ start:661 stop:903 length:243 start_codon:yes stop_codon:yes gene_type:complete
MARKKQDAPMVDICTLLFKQRERPKNLEVCKAINVYDNKYRINVYTRSYDDFWDIDKVRITQSYFAKLEGDNLTIVSPKL